MLIYYGYSVNRPDVHCDSPVNESLDIVFSIFRALDHKRGFLAVMLDRPFVLQLSPRSRGRTVIELLDTCKRAFDECTADPELAEQLIRAAAAGHDVFHMARSSVSEWNHVDL